MGYCTLSSISGVPEKCGYCGEESYGGSVPHSCEGVESATRGKKIREAVEFLSDLGYSVYEPGADIPAKLPTPDLQMELLRRKDRPEPPTWFCERCGADATGGDFPGGIDFPVRVRGLHRRGL